MLVLRRHVGEVLRVHVGRIGDDQIEALPRQAGETVALHGVDALAQLMPLDVDIGHFQRIEGQVGQHHFGPREGMCAGNADAAGTGAEVEDARRLGSQPGFEMLLDQLADGRTRHQHAFVDHERHIAEPGLAKQISRRHALVDASKQERH
ncbi:hypothetical protein D9M71_446620 [compost metagenome]